MEFHEIANLFPMMADDEFDALVEDIKANDLREPIWTYQGKIIDGRNRYRACQKADVSPRTHEWDGKGSLVDFVLSQNLHRRHLTSSQKAVIAMEIEKLVAEEARQKEARRKTTFQKTEKSNLPPVQAAQQAAAIVGTNRQYVSDAKKIEREAPALIQPIREGRISLPEACAATKLPDQIRPAVIEKIATGKAASVQVATEQVISEQIDSGEIEIGAPLHADILKQVEADPENRWVKAFNKLWGFISSTKHHGDITELIRPWKTETKRHYLDSLRRMHAEISKWIKTLEKEIKNDS